MPGRAVLAPPPGLGLPKVASERRVPARGLIARLKFGCRPPVHGRSSRSSCARNPQNTLPHHQRRRRETTADSCPRPVSAHHPSGATSVVPIRVHKTSSPRPFTGSVEPRQRIRRLHFHNQEFDTPALITPRTPGHWCPPSFGAHHRSVRCTMPSSFSRPFSPSLMGLR